MVAVRRETRCLEDLRERVAERRPVPVDGQVREHDERRDDDDADDPQPPCRTLPAGIEERLTDGEQPPAEDQRVER